jgi:hypothetical protein
LRLTVTKTKAWLLGIIVSGQIRLRPRLLYDLAHTAWRETAERMKSFFSGQLYLSLPFEPKPIEIFVLF